MICIINLLTGIPSSPVLTYESTSDCEILLSWSPVGSDTVCGPVTYNITVMPSHGMIMMINDTVYNITGLNNNTFYTITVFASNMHGNGEPATVTVKTKQGIYIHIAHVYCNAYKYINQFYINIVYGIYVHTYIHCRLITKNLVFDLRNSLMVTDIHK